MENHYSQRLSAKGPKLLIITASWGLAIGIPLGWLFYTSLPDRTATRQAAEVRRQVVEVLSMTTAQTSVPDDYDQPATPQHTRQELERQRCLEDYRFPLFRDIQERCERCCTETSVLCPLIREIHAIHARGIGTDTKFLVSSRSSQDKKRTTREELKWLARLDEERSSMLTRLRRRCDELCSDSPRPCHIWQEVYRIHGREMDAQEKEGGESGSLRQRLNRLF